MTEILAWESQIGAKKMIGCSSVKQEERKPEDVSLIYLNFWLKLFRYYIGFKT